MNNGNLSGIISQPLIKKYSKDGRVFCDVALVFQVKTSKSGYETQFMDFKVWGSQAEAVLDNCRKGTKIWITYELRSRRWVRQDGTKAKVVEPYIFLVEWQPVSKRPKQEAED